jgi:hypothetical protein
MGTDRRAFYATLCRGGHVMGERGGRAGGLLAARVMQRSAASGTWAMPDGAGHAPPAATAKGTATALCKSRGRPRRHSRR